MAEPIYVRDVTGQPTVVTPERYATGHFQDRPVVHPEVAAQQNQQLQDRAFAEQELGEGGIAALGFAQGLGAGIPGLAAIYGPQALGFNEQAEYGRRLLAGSEQFGGYKLGEVAGLVAPALAGEVGNASGAGMLGMAGTATERLAARLLPETAGILGSAAKSGLKMAARGATEGALIGLSQQLNQSAIHNIPLTVESLAASTSDGALFGFLAGGGIGAVGGLGSGVAGKVGDVLAGRGNKAEARILQRVGLTSDEVSRISSNEGGSEAWIRRARGNLGEAGFAGKTGAIAKEAEVAASNWSKTRQSYLDVLDREASGSVPLVERIRERAVTEIAAPYQGTPFYKPAYRAIRDFTDKIFAEEYRVNVRSGAANDSYRTSWSKWGQTRDLLSEKYDKLIGGTKDSAVLSNPDVKRRFIGIIDSEMVEAMKAAESKGGNLAGISESYKTALVQKRTAEELAAATSRKASAETAHGVGSTWNAPDIAQAAGMTFGLGQPAAAAGLLAGKGLIRRLGGLVEPHLAEMAWKNLASSQAASSSAMAKGKIKAAMGKFFQSGRKASTLTYSKSSAKARASGQKYDRTRFEADLEATRSLLSNLHRQRVEEFAQMASQGIHPGVGPQILNTYNRASEYLNWNIPPGNSAIGSGSLRPMPKVHGMDLKEFKFMRMHEAISNPLSILDKMEDGSVSRDAVQAMKYVYPELHSEIVQEATTQIYEMKASGKFLPMDKIASLGIVLDSPIDSTLTPDFVSAVQQSFVSPEVVQPDPQLQSPQLPAESLQQNIQALGTPLEQSLQG